MTENFIEIKTDFRCCFVGMTSIFQKMKGLVTGKVVDWANGETMDQMLDQFSPMDYTGLSLIISLESLITVI